MLLLAATTASATTGALVMAAFGIGTLPAMVTATVAFERAAGALSRRASLRTVAGALLLAFGGWTAGNALYHGLAHSGHGGHKSESTQVHPPGHDGAMPAGHEGHDMGAGVDSTGAAPTGATTPAPAEGESPAAGQDHHEHQH
jgi:hypothetical protein